jgi:hypothetical protein
MKESYSEGEANHAGLGSYAAVRKGGGGTLIEGRTGRVLSREISLNQGADAVLIRGRQHELQRKGELERGPARSETPGMYGNRQHGDWEIPRSSAKAADRVGKSKDEHRR